jgi:hypothetical protein
MAKDLDVSNSNNILKTIVIILVVVGISYLVYYLYTQNNHSKKIDGNTRHETHEMQHPPLNNNKLSVNGMNVTKENYGNPSGLNDPIMQKQNYLPKGPITGEENMEHFSQNPNYGEVRNETSFPKEQLTADELLPQDNSSLWAQVNPSGEGSLKDRNFLQSGYHIGINTVGQTLRNANLQLRSEPPCPQVKVSPWLQATIEPDVSRKPFEIGGCA